MIIVWRTCLYGTNEVNLNARAVSPHQANFYTLNEIEQEGLVPAMPQLSPDGKTLYFAAISKNDLTEEYNDNYPSKRQLYSIQLNNSRKISQITTDKNYRNENPLLLKSEELLIFGRANAEPSDGKMEIWVVNLKNRKETKLVEWKEPEETNMWMAYKYDDFYGRGSWEGILAIYDGTIARN